MGIGFATATRRDDAYYERLKLIFLTCAFFCVIGAYTVAKELKNSVFAYTVGEDYIPWVRTGAMLALIPAIFLYSILVDRLRRYQLLCVYSGIYAILGLIFAYLIGHPAVGLVNTQESPYRLFGWIFYFFVEGYSPFVVSVFWAFANSVNSPEGAKKNYGYMVSGSKLGGMLTAGLSILLLNQQSVTTTPLSADVFNHQVLLVGASLLLLLVPLIIFTMMKRVPGKYLHGYEAVYQVEKERQKHGESKTGMFAGLTMLIKYPYVLGIFGMSFFYEVLSTILSYLSIKVAKVGADCPSETLSYLMYIIFWTHCVGFFISLFGTGWLFKRLGTRYCLMLVPLTAGVVLFFYMFNVQSAQALVVAFVALRAINYAFSWPLRESLYIPTVKEIKFKSKSWIDAFGSKFAKTSGSTFNIVARWIGPASYMSTYSCFFAGIVGLWCITALLLGRRFERAIAKSEVIGIDEE
jgi:AAA family ATP:ADP antiporter